MAKEKTKCWCDCLRAENTPEEQAVMGIYPPLPQPKRLEETYEASAHLSWWKSEMRASETNNRGAEMRDDRRSERREGNGVEKRGLIQFISLWWATNKCNWRLKSIQERRVGEALQRGNQSRAGETRVPWVGNTLAACKYLMHVNRRRSAHKECQTEAYSNQGNRMKLKDERKTEEGLLDCGILFHKQRHLEADATSH